MSETIECRGEIYVEELHEIAPHYPIENLERMLTKFPKSDIFLDDCADGDFFLLVRNSRTRYTYLSDEPDDEIQDGKPCVNSEWNRFMSRSYKIIRDTGALPYAHRS